MVEQGFAGLGPIMGEGLGVVGGSFQKGVLCSVLVLWASFGLEVGIVSGSLCCYSG